MVAARPFAVFPGVHPVFVGHFPGDPMVPGVLLLDELIHRLAQELGLSYTQLRVQAVKFLAPVRPGDPVSWVFAALPNEVFSFVLSVADREIAVGTVAVRPA